MEREIVIQPTWTGNQRTPLGPSSGDYLEYVRTFTTKMAPMNVGKYSSTMKHLGIHTQSTLLFESYGQETMREAAISLGRFSPAEVAGHVPHMVSKMVGLQMKIPLELMISKKQTT